MSQRDIAQTIEEIYGFKVSKDMISRIIDKILPEINGWQNRQLQACYPFIFVDCMYVSMKSDGYVTKRAVYSILAYRLDGTKELLGISFATHKSDNRPAMTCCSATRIIQQPTQIARLYKLQKKKAATRLPSFLNILVTIVLAFVIISYEMRKQIFFFHNQASVSALAFSYSFNLK